MTIQPISPASVALYLTPADLQERGVHPEQLDLARTLEIAREAFQQVGILLDGELELEAYPEECGVLVFARVRQPASLTYSFSNWEDLLSAVASLSPPLPDGALSLWNGRWWLTLPGQASAAGARLSEFGCPETADPYIDARLEEYGAALLGHSAPAALRAFFHL